MKSNPHAAPAIVRRVRAWPRRWRLALLAALTVAALFAVLALPPFPQPQAYHHFADQRGWLGVPHFLNVASNAVLVLAGAAGLWFVLAAPGRPKRPAPPRGAANEVSLGAVIRRGKWSDAGVRAQPWERTPYLVFFLGVLLTGFGSAWYHWMPDSGRLTWDRLPMTLIFMSFLAAAVGERISARAARLGLAPLLVLGMASVILWHMGEQRGVGDLRLYGFVQFYTALMIPVIVLLFPSRYGGDREVLHALGLYALAMLCGELLDAQLFALGQIVSGHTLKHLLAGAAAYRVLRMLTARRGWPAVPKRPLPAFWVATLLAALVAFGLGAHFLDLFEWRDALDWTRGYAQRWWLPLTLILLQVVLFMFALPGSTMLWIVAPLYAPSLRR